MAVATLSPASSDLLDRAAEVIPGGVNTCRRRSEPRLCFARGAGAHLWDLEGRRYIDYHAAYGAIRLARGVTGREKIVKFQGAYNGFHDYVLRNTLSPAELVGRRAPES